MASAPIPITYYNKTGKNDFEVVVFTKNENPNAIDTPFVAWRVLKAQTAAQFVYPVDVAVGATWSKDGIKNFAGPFTANLGSTWRLTMATSESSPTLADAHQPPNPQGTIVVQNMKPASWSGKPFDFGLYKDGSLLVTQHAVGVANQADFHLTPFLYFGVVSEIQVGAIFKSLTITQANFKVDLGDYSNGLDMTLTVNPSSGEYTFKPSVSGRTQWKQT